MWKSGTTAFAAAIESHNDVPPGRPGHPDAERMNAAKCRARVAFGGEDDLVGKESSNPSSCKKAAAVAPPSPASMTAMQGFVSRLNGNKGRIDEH